MHEFRPIDKEKKIYIIMSDNSRTVIDKDNHENSKIFGKICLTINIDNIKHEVVVSPGYSKTYYRNLFCNYECSKKDVCNQNTWNNACFDVNPDIDSMKIHITRHDRNIERGYENGLLHQGVLNSQKKRQCFSFVRPAFSDITDYEFIAGFQLSEVVLDRFITKDFAKEKLVNKILIRPDCNKVYRVYVFLSPKNQESIYADLEKYNLDIAKLSNDNFDLVVAVETVSGVSNIAICDFTRMYITLHEKDGIGCFKPIS